MATDSILGLFTTPEQYQQAQLQQLYGNQLAQARLSPVEQASFNIGAGAQRAGDVVGRALGGEDPMLQQLSQRQQLLRNIDFNDPTSLANASRAALERNDVQASRELAMAAEKARAAQLESAVKTSQIARNVRESKTEQQRNYETAVGQGFQGTLQDFILEQRRAGAPKTNIGITQKQEEAITKSNVEAFGTLRDEAIAAGRTLEAVQSIKPLINQAFTGFASNTKLTAGQIADTFGIPVQGTTETERMRSIQNNLKIGNSTVLKGAISDKDMAILGEAIGQGNTTAGGIRGIINDLEKNALISQSKYQRANNFQQQGKLSQYDFVEGDKAATKDVNDKLKRIRELEAKAQGAK
jgi:hypothetical protein